MADSYPLVDIHRALRDAEVAFTYVSRSTAALLRAGEGQVLRELATLHANIGALREMLATVVTPSLLAAIEAEQDTAQADDEECEWRRAERAMQEHHSA